MTKLRHTEDRRQHAITAREEREMSQRRCGEEIPRGTVLEDLVVSPGSHWASIVPQGAVLRIVDLEGKQAVDFLCYAAKDP